MASGYYDITNKTLGKGHYGVVKLGRHCLTGEPVAMKIIEKSRLNNDSLHQLGTEIRILFRLSEYEHPNILKLYQTIDTEDRLFLVTEYCGPHACDLHEYLSRSREGLKGRTAQVFFTQIVSAIAYCHSLGIVHRDLKPENILVTDHRHLHTNIVFDGDQDHEFQYPLLKLIDFGFANQWVPDEKMHTSCGTLAYSAPELLLGEPYDGTKVDVWGLGLMLYILLYGGNPFMQINDNETLTRILDCSFATPAKDTVDSSAIELLRSLIKRNPDNRLTIDAILRHNWFSGIPKTFEPMLERHTKPEHTTSTKQLHGELAQQVMSPTLPSISECGPLKNLNRSLDDDPKLIKYNDNSEKPNHNRTRSLSITRSYNKASQQLALTKTRSSMNLGRLHQQTSSPTTPITPINFLRSSPLYRPTSPDVSGLVLLTDEEKKLHKNVLQEVFRLTKLIESEASIEASLKNARTAHRLFNESSIKPAQFVSRLSGSLVKTLSNVSQISSDKQRVCSSMNSVSSRNSSVDRLSVINNKLSNDDYIYATYQLTRDRVLRDTREQLKKQSKGTRVSKENPTRLTNEGDVGGKSPISDKDLEATKKGEDRASTKENENNGGQQRKFLQPQHKMRDKFTSFFRSGSTSPSGSFSATLDPKGSNPEANALVLGTFHEADQHEAFNDHDAETGGVSGARYFGSDAEPYENAVAYALPLARKCSLVSEESGCSTEFPES